MNERKKQHEGLNKQESGARRGKETKGRRKTEERMKEIIQIYTSYSR